MLTARIPTPSLVTCLICVKSNIYCVQRNNSSVHSVAVTLSCDTLFLTTSSFFFLPQKRVIWIFFWLTLSQQPLKRSSLLPDYRKNHLIWMDSSLMVPLSALGRLFRGPASRLTVSGTIWSEWTRSEQSPLASCSKIPLECLFRSIYICYLLCILLYICSPINCSMIVHYSDPWNVFRVFQSCNWNHIVASE
jgi:hypothetical protein